MKRSVKRAIIIILIANVILIVVNWDGAYYQEKILPEHTVKTNDKVLNRITLGKITVNYE